MGAAVEKFEFGSSGWLAAAREHVLGGLADVELDGIEYSFCCRYTDAPAHLLEAGKTSIDFHVVIHDGQARFGLDPLDRADFHLTADWAACQELGRIAKTTPGGAERLARLIEAGIASGKLRGTGLDQPGPACFEALELHDFLAVRTR